MEKFWRGRRVLVTGHTGFKGSWLSLWLNELGAEVIGLALEPSTKPSLFSIVGGDFRSIIGDIRDADLVQRVFRETCPEIVIHMAAQALVRASYRDPIGTYASNVMGSAHVLQACRALPHMTCALIVTTDKVYENNNAGRSFVEDDRLGGHDPYSNSKACAELLTQSFRDSFFADGPPVATARAGNVIGGGDWAEDRLIPDCVRAFEQGRSVYLRYPYAVRPWQHVLEPLSGYLALVRALIERPDTTPKAVNFGPDSASFSQVHEVVDVLSSQFGRGKNGWWSDDAVHPPEAAALTLSSDTARATLGWRPRLDIETTLAWTADWYRAHRAGENCLALCLDQIRQYQAREHHKMTVN